MAVYRTTDTELTSIADAIRAKTGGSSSLVYPTGFVSAINSISTSGGSASSNNLILKDANGDTTSTSAISSDITLGTKSITPTSSAQIITPETGLDGYHTINVGATPAYSYMGENAVFVQNMYEQEITLDDTTFSSWTPSTSTATIFSSTKLTGIYLPVNNDYIIKTIGYVKYAYTQEVTVSAYTNYYTIGYIIVGQRPQSPSALVNENFNYVTYVGGSSNQLATYYTSNGSSSLTANNYGIYVSQSTPSLSSQSSTTDFALSINTPQVRAVANSSSMSTSAFQYIDSTNTKIYMKVDLYKCESRKDFYHETIREIINIHNTLYPTT